jgi:hypothetical protein
MKKAKLVEQKEKKYSKEKPEIKFSIRKFIVVVVIISVILGLFYFLTEKIVKNMDTTDSNSNSNITYDKAREVNNITYDELKKMKATSYFVLLDKADDENNDNYDTFIDILNYHLSVKFYYVDLSKDANKDLLGDKESLESIDKLKVKDTTLIYVSDSKISNTYVGSEKILEYLASFFSLNSNSNSNSTSNSNSNK